MDLSQLPIAKIFWTLLTIEAVAFVVLLMFSFRAGSSGPEGLVGAWILMIPPIIWAVLAWLFARTESTTARLAYTLLLLLPLVQLALGPIVTSMKRASWERGWRGADYFSAPEQLQLANAIYEHDLEQVNRLIPAAGDLNKPYKQGTTLFDYAMSNSDKSEASLEIVRAMLAAGANPNVPPARPLTLAILEGQRVTQVLLDAGADPNARDGTRPVWWTVLSAANDEDLTLLRLLLDRGADIKIRDSEGGPVAWAAYHKAWRAMWLLIERGADWKDEQMFGQSVHRMMLTELGYRQDVPEAFRLALAKYEAAAKEGS